MIARRAKLSARPDLTDALAKLGRIVDGVVETRIGQR